MRLFDPVCSYLTYQLYDSRVVYIYVLYIYTKSYITIIYYHKNTFRNFPNALTVFAHVSDNSLALRLGVPSPSPPY